MTWQSKRKYWFGDKTKNIYYFEYTELKWLNTIQLTYQILMNIKILLRKLCPFSPWRTLYMNYSSLIFGVNKLIRVSPAPLFCCLFYSSSVNVAHDTTSRDPDDGWTYYHGADNVVLQETHHLVDINVFNNVPETFDNVLNSLLAYSLKISFQKAIINSKVRP